MIYIFDKKTPYNDALLSNGVYQLDKIIEYAETTEDIQGNYELDISIELTEGVPTELYEMLQVDNIIKVNDEGSDELFRIAQINKGLERIELYCRHITISDSLNLWLDNVRPTDLNGNAALQWLAERTKPQCNLVLSSNITNKNTADYVNKNLYEALFDGDNSFINKWGGEIKRQGINIMINDKIGEDKTKVIKIKESLNLTEFNAKTNIDDVITVIYPVGFDGLRADPVRSSKVDLYSMEFPREIKYEDVKVQKKNDETGEITQDGYATEELAKAELRRRAGLEFTEKKVDEIQFECDIDYIDLNKYDEYKYLSTLQTASLGDFVSVIVNTFNLELKVRIVSRKFDVLRQQRISNTISTDGKMKQPISIDKIINDLADKIETQGAGDLSGYIDSMIQQGFTKGYIVVTKNAIFAVDTLPKEKAKNVVVFNNGGIGFSSTGIDGKYTYGFTIDGKINADMITVGALGGQYIKAGSIEADRLSIKAKEEITKGMATDSTIVGIQADIEGIKTQVQQTTSQVGQVGEAFKNFKEQANNRFDGLNSELSNFHDYLNQAFKDGIIDEAEAKIIKDRLNAMEIEKTDIDKEYDRLYNHDNLTGTPEKTELKNRKIIFDSSYNNLMNEIKIVISDKKIDGDESQRVESATTLYKNALGDYRGAYINALNKVGEKYSDIALKNAKYYADSKITQTAEQIKLEVTKVQNSVGNITNRFNAYETQANSRFNTLESQLNDFEGVIQGAFKDGIISEAEAKIIGERLNSMAIEYDKIQKEYKDLYAHENLTGTSEKNQLYNAKLNYDDAYNQLVNSIKKAIGDSKITPTENQDVKNKTNAYKQYLGEYRVAFVNALNKIGAKYSDMALNSAKIYANSKITQTADQIKAEVTRVEGNVNNVTNQFNTYKAQANSKFDRIESSLQGFEGILDESFKDGIIDAAESKVIADRINTMAIEDSEIQKEYTRVYNHPNLNNTDEKTDLYNKKIWYDNGYNALVNAINDAIYDKKITPTEDQNVKRATTNYKAYLSDYKVSFINAVNKIGEKYSNIALENAKSYANSKITQSADQIRAEVTRVERKVDNFAVGGHNYILKSNFEYSSGEYPIPQFDIDDYKMLQNKQVTLSFEIQGSGAFSRVGFEPYLQLSNGTKKYLSTFVYSSYYGEKKRIKATFTIDNYTVTGVGQLYPIVDNLYSGWVTIGRPQLEIGTVATDYNPNPKDIESKVDKAIVDIKPDKIVSQVIQSTQFTDAMGNKVDKNRIISEINQTAERIRIQANRLELAGAVSIQDNSRSYIKIEDADYSVFHYNDRKASFGIRNEYNNGAWERIPNLKMGYYGVSDNSVINRPYFIQSAYPSQNNPQNDYDDYFAQSFKCTKSSLGSSQGAYSGVKYSNNGSISISPLTELIITSNKLNGNPNGTTITQIAKFESSSNGYYYGHLQTDGVIRKGSNDGWGCVLGYETGYNDAYVSVTCGNSGKSFRPLTYGDVDCGTSSKPWSNVYSIYAKLAIKKDVVLKRTKIKESVIDLIDVDLITTEEGDKYILNTDRLENNELSSILLEKPQEGTQDTKSKEDIKPDGDDKNVFVDIEGLLSAMIHEIKELKEQNSQLIKIISGE